MAIEGEIDIANSAILEEAIVPVHGGAPTVVDLSELRFIDLAGLRALVDACRSTEARDVPVCCVIPDGSVVARLLSLSRLAGLRTRATLEEATAAVTRASGGRSAPGS